MSYFYDWVNRYFFRKLILREVSLPRELRKDWICSRDTGKSSKPLNSSSLPNRPVWFWKTREIPRKMHGTYVCIYTCQHVSERLDVDCVAPTESGFNRPKISCSERFHGIIFFRCRTICCNLLSLLYLYSSPRLSRKMILSMAKYFLKRKVFIRSSS